jgi:hypothetical protein
MSKFSCVAKTSVRNRNNRYEKKFIRISCGNTIFAHDKNEVDAYMISVMDDELSTDCQVYDYNCVDCMAYCENTLLAIEVINEEGLKDHIEIDGKNCKIKKQICLNNVININKLINVLVLYNISDPNSIYHILNCSDLRYKNINFL